MIKDIEKGIASTLRTAWYTAIDLPWAGVGASIGAIAVGLGAGVGIVAPISQLTEYIINNPDLNFSQTATKSAIYIFGTAGALFGSVAVNYGTAREAASMGGAWRHYRPTEQELKERTIAETVSTLAATAAVPYSIYHYDLATKIIDRTFN